MSEETKKEDEVRTADILIEDSEGEVHHYVGIGIGLGTAFGVTFGVVFGEAIFSNVGAGIGAGIADVPPSVVPHPMLDLEPTAGQEAGAF